MAPGTVRALAGGCLLGCLLLVLHGLLLGFYFEPTTEALEDAAKGKAVGYPAAAGLVAAGFAFAGARRRWGVVALVIGLALGVLALALDLVM